VHRPTTYRFIAATNSAGSVSEHSTRAGVSVGLIKIGNWKRCPLWLNRSVAVHVAFETKLNFETRFLLDRLKG
jgi:hypothetical protein